MVSRCSFGMRSIFFLGVSALLLGCILCFGGVGALYASQGKDGKPEPIESVVSTRKKVDDVQNPGEPPLQRAKEPTLVILVQFEDTAGSTGPFPQGFGGEWANEVFGPRPSLQDYYLEVSYSGLLLTPAPETQPPVNDGVVGWYTIGWTDNTGVRRINHPWNVAAALGLANPDDWVNLWSGNIAREAVLAAAANVNFAGFDTNGDRFISTRELHVIIVVAGFEAAFQARPAPKTWAHHLALGAGVVVPRQGVTVLQQVNPTGNLDQGGYSMVGELDPGTGTNIRFGLLAHEMGHDLGLPDLYDTQPVFTGPSEGIGEWGLMGSGNWLGVGRIFANSPAHICAILKADPQLSWIVPISVIAWVPLAVLPSIEAVPTAYRIRSPAQRANEYFLVSNRQLILYDRSLPGAGLLIWHIDDGVLAAGLAINSVNGDETHKGVDLECADQPVPGHAINADDLDTRVNRGDGNDPYGFWGSFNRASSPDNRDYAGVLTMVSILCLTPSFLLMIASLSP